MPPLNAPGTHCSRRKDALAARLRLGYFVLLKLILFSSCQTTEAYVATSPWSKNARKSSSRMTSSTTVLDPLLWNVLQEEEEEMDESQSTFLGGLLQASQGLAIWRTALSKGRFPLQDEFPEQVCWPPEPLFAAISKTFEQLELARFAAKHPESLSTILLSLIRLALEFQKRQLEMAEVDDEASESLEEEDQDDPYYYDWDYEPVESVTDYSYLEALDRLENSDERIAEELSGELLNEWSSVVAGVGMLDQLFGQDHGMLNGGSIGPGFGVTDGVWQDTGWKVIASLQSQIQGMPELKALVSKLGRRPTAETRSRRLEKFAPRKTDPQGGLGAQMDPIARESVDGVCLSGSLSEMLPSEAILLKGSFPVLRRLFLAKKVESKLWSYQISGWADVPSIPQTKSRYRSRLPSAPGGPIIVCLDTSWSMGGGIRENLSKAVVLSCVSQAHKQGRECQVVAFSTANKVMESGVLGANADGLHRLLDFLSHGFGGGTDVTGALKYAMNSLESNALADADILLVSDGEIPDPPMPEEMMKSLDTLKVQKGVQVHGLLVGKSESKPMSRICTTMHDFLNKYDTLSSFLQSAQRGSQGR